MKSVGGNPGQSTVIKNHHRISILSQSSHRQQAVVRMNHDVSRVGSIRENRVGLDELLGESIIEPLQQERSKSRTRTTSNRMQHHKSLNVPASANVLLVAPFMRPCPRPTYLEGVTSVGLAVDHLHNILMNTLARLVTLTPVVGSSDAILAHKEVLGIVNVLVRAGLDTIDHSGLQINEDGAGDVARVVGLVEKHIFAIAALGREVFKVAILRNTVFLAQLLPELTANFVGNRSADELQLPACFESTRHSGVRKNRGDSLLLPHWPAWTVMISLADIVVSLGDATS